MFQSEKEKVFIDISKAIFLSVLGTKSGEEHHVRGYLSQVDGINFGLFFGTKRHQVLLKKDDYLPIYCSVGLEGQGIHFKDFVGIEQRWKVIESHLGQKKKNNSAIIIPMFDGKRQNDTPVVETKPMIFVHIEKRTVPWSNEKEFLMTVTS